MIQNFIPATDKLEAVNRLSYLARGPLEELGPGSKERKSVLITLAKALALPDEMHKLSKPQLGAMLAKELDVPWDKECWSTGSTITLPGLNRLLEGAQRICTPHEVASKSAVQEAFSMISIIKDCMPPNFDGRTAIDTMFHAASTQWAQSEWQGFFFEFLTIPRFINHMGGGPIQSPGNTKFDFMSSHIWDLKTHVEGKSEVILNDQTATKWAIESGGLGFVILTGKAEFDPDFRIWFTKFKHERGKDPRPRVGERKFVRRLKSSFKPTKIEVFYFPDADAWKQAETYGAIKGWKQPPQPTRQPRNPKFSLYLPLAREYWMIAAHEFQQ